MLEPQSITLSEAFALFDLDNQSRRFTPPTIQFYRYHIAGRFTAWCSDRDVITLADVTPAIIRAYLLDLQGRGWAEHSIHGAARAVRAFLNFCIREELIAESPMSKVSMPKVGKRILPALTVEDARLLLAACESERDKAALLFLLDTGLRATEFVALNGGHIDLTLGTVRVVQGKGQKDRTGYLGTRTRKQVLRYYLDAGRPGAPDPVWRNERTGRRMTTSGLRQLLRRLAKRADVPNVKPHTLRRTFALWSLRAGMSIYHLQRLMGHEDITTLRHYLALVDSDIAQAHRDYGAVDSML